MMEQLAERRMRREEDAHYAANGMRPSSLQGHNHGPPLDDDGYDDEEDDEYDSQDYDDDDDEEDDTVRASDILIEFVVLIALRGQ